MSVNDGVVLYQIHHINKFSPPLLLNQPDLLIYQRSFSLLCAQGANLDESHAFLPFSIYFLYYSKKTNIYLCVRDQWLINSSVRGNCLSPNPSSSKNFLSFFPFSLFPSLAKKEINKRKKNGILVKCEVCGLALCRE